MPENERGETMADEAEWVRVEDGFITKNTARTLEFYLPRTLEEGKRYFIAVRTAVSGSTELKSPVLGISAVSVVIES